MGNMLYYIRIGRTSAHRLFARALRRLSYSPSAMSCLIVCHSVGVYTTPVSIPLSTLVLPSHHSPFQLRPIKSFSNARTYPRGSGSPSIVIGKSGQVSKAERSSSGISVAAVPNASGCCGATPDPLADCAFAIFVRLSCTVLATLFSAWMVFVKGRRSARMLALVYSMAAATHSSWTRSAAQDEGSGEAMMCS